MASTPEDLLSIANELSDSDEEIKIRTSISRSYYSAYHLALRYLGDTSTSQWLGGDGGVHQKLISLLQYSDKVNERGASYILKELKGKRVLADYYLNRDFSKDEAKASIKLVNSLINKLKI